jgi:prefoldin beta subunit
MSQKSNALKAVSDQHSYSLEYRKVVQGKQIMAEKKNENDMVLQEFKMLGDGANVYKLVGPILAKQDLDECKSNV